MTTQEEKQVEDYTRRFNSLSDSILYKNGYSKEEIESFSESQKLAIFQSLDLLTEC